MDGGVTVSSLANHSFIAKRLLLGLTFYNLVGELLLVLDVTHAVVRSANTMIWE